MMRKSERYTVPFPPAKIPADLVYRDRFGEFPFWYRLYLRLLAVVNGLPLEQIVRRHDLTELRRRLNVVAREVIDTTAPALLPGFHNRLRNLERLRRRITPALRETRGQAQGRFLLFVLKRLDEETYYTLDAAARIPATLLESTETTPAVAQEAVRTHVTAELEVQYSVVERTLHPIWTSLQALSLLERFDFSALVPVDPAVGRTPMRVVRTPLQEFYQVLDLVRRHANTTATEQAWEFARRQARLNPGPAGSIWSAIEEFWNAVPLLDITRLAWDEPFLEVRSLALRSDWWEPFQQAWFSRATRRTTTHLLTHRNEQVREILARVFMIEDPPASWLPSELYPATLGYTMLLARSEFFHDTRRVVTQLVIDAVFHHLDTRNALHQAALQIDKALERLTALLGDGENRGTLGEELHRTRQRSGSSTLARQRLVALYERHRHRIQTSLESFLEALETGGTLVQRTLAGTEIAFDYTQLRAQSFSGDFPAEELLQTVGYQWLPLARRLRALYRLESGEM